MIYVSHLLFFKQIKLVNVCAINKKSHRQLIKFASSQKIQFVKSVSKNPNPRLRIDLMQIQLVDGGISNKTPWTIPVMRLLCIYILWHQAGISWWQNSSRRFHLSHLCSCSASYQQWEVGWCSIHTQMWQGSQWEESRGKQDWQYPMVWGLLGQRA